MTEMQFKVLDMKCTGCESTIRKRLLKLDGVLDARANHKTGEVHLTVRQQDFCMANVDAAIRELGYTPDTD